MFIDKDLPPCPLLPQPYFKATAPRAGCTANCRGKLKDLLGNWTGGRYFASSDKRSRFQTLNMHCSKGSGYAEVFFLFC